MITVESGKFIIPEEERFIGFSGDDSVVQKQILVRHRNVPNTTFTLCLRFDDGQIKSVLLAAEAIGSDRLLTWTVRREDMVTAGVVTAQVKMTDGEGNTEHTTKDYFWIGSAVELDESGAEIERITPSQLEERVQEAVRQIRSTLPYLGEDGFWYVYDSSEGEYFKTGYLGALQVDNAMSGTSRNPVENKTVTAYISAAIATLRTEIGDIENALAAI